MNKLITAIILGACTLSALAGVVVTYPQNTQTDSESDRQTAVDTATQNATNWANSQCVGNVTNDATISVNVMPVGDQFMATVTVRATCEAFYRGR